MPKVVLMNKTGTIDVTNMTSTIKWSGSTSQIARVLELDFLYPLHDHYAPRIYPNISDEMYLYDDTGEELFRGRVFYNERFGEQGTIQITCYDDAIKLSKSKGTYNFKNKTAEAITRIVCNDLGISVGELAYTGIAQKMLCSDMNMYDIIKEAYESAGSQNGKKYLVIMKQGKLCVEKVGDEVVDYTLHPDVNIIESSYSENAESVVNKVKIYDEKDQYFGVVQNDELIDLLGTFQEVYVKEADRHPKAVAQSILRGINREIKVRVTGNIKYISGKQVRVNDSSVAKIFYISDDEHKWDQNTYDIVIELKNINLI